MVSMPLTISSIHSVPSDQVMIISFQELGLGFASAY